MIAPAIRKCGVDFAERFFARRRRRHELLSEGHSYQRHQCKKPALVAVFFALIQVVEADFR
jgi:hypothetical protein